MSRQTSQIVFAILPVVAFEEKEEVADTVVVERMVFPLLVYVMAPLLASELARALCHLLSEVVEGSRAVYHSVE